MGRESDMHMVPESAAEVARRRGRKPDAERIPAAIEKAEAELDGAAWMFLDIKEEVVITAGEVALAKALEREHDAHWKEEPLGEDYVLNTSCEEAECEACAALRAFAEKVESL